MKYLNSTMKSKVAFGIRTLNTFFNYPIFRLRSNDDYKKIPIIINNRNRYTYLQVLINSLEKKGYRNIFIIDNDSDYPDLLAFYKSLPYKVFRLNKNLGYTALWDSYIFEEFKDNYYVYTDSDLEIIDECPDDFMSFFLFLHKKYPDVGKIGFGLKTDDLPEYYINSQKVKEWESALLQKGRRLEKFASLVQIDTTFALYKKGKKGPAHTMASIRTVHPYIMKHLPWYERSDQLSEEQIYYYKNVSTSTHWSHNFITGK